MGQGGRVLVTGGTGAFGLAAGKWLARSGYDVVAMARNEPATLPHGVRFVQGDIADLESVRRAMDGCDAVIHLAWVLSSTVSEASARPINIGGTQNVLDAMTDTGCGRLVFASSVTAYGAHPEHDGIRWREDEPLNPHRAMTYEWHKAQAERMIEASGVPALRVRPTVVVGRNVYNTAANVFRQVVVPDLGRAAEMQFVHQEDVGRFFAHATGLSATGAVNLAPADSLKWSEIARLAQRRSMPTPVRPLSYILGGASRTHRVADSFSAAFNLLLHWPIVDTTRLNDELGFEPVWTSAEAMADQGRTNRGYTFVGLKRMRNVTTLDRTIEKSMPLTPENVKTLSKPSLLGEFDTRDFDPTYPEWTSSNLARKFSGPMTPLSLQMAQESLLMTAEVIARMLPLEDRVREVVRTKLVGVFGHQPFQNISAMRKVVSSVPGLRPEDVVHEMSGRAHSEGRRRPKIGRGAFDFRATIAFALVTRPRLAGLDRSVAEVVGRAQELAAGISDLSRLSDASLINRIELVRDDLIRARQVSDVCSFMVGVRDGGYAATALAAISQHGAEFADGANLAEIHDLATRARDDDVVTTLLSGNIEAQTWDLVCANAPHFARATRELLQAVGHCGPTETELANPTYAEEPHLLLKAVASAMKAGDQNVSARDGSTGLGRRRAAMNAKSMARRARARNAVSLTINQMRMALREWGDRLVAVHIVVERDDVYYLTFEELFTVSAAEAGSLVERRRAERARLQGMTFPVRFECEVDADGDWSVPWLTG